MSPQPLSAEQRSGVLYITFDTPGCPVNIFSQQAALQLLGLLEGLDATVRVVVLRSAKPDSFINGVGLMLASAVSKPEDVPRLTSTVRRAYRAVAELAVPTVAAIRGNCYGCGVELATRFRYRIAADSCDTHFYMTEVADYLFIPTFGGTQYLPRILGLESATEFLLWGQRWSAREATERGLLHGCFPDDSFDDAVERIVGDLSRHGKSDALLPPRHMPSTEIEGHGRHTRERIRRLPPTYRPVYETCYELVAKAAVKETAEEADFDAEMLASGRSLMTAVSKAAVGFFFVHQLCEQVCLRGAREQKTFHLCFDSSQPGPRFVREELERRRIRGVTLDDASESPGSPDALHMVVYGRSLPTVARHPVAVTDLLQRVPAWSAGVDVVMYAPSWRHGIAFVEVACRRPSEDGQRVFRLLAKAGIRCVITRPTKAFLINDLLCSYLRPQLAFIDAGNTAADVAATLLDVGFTRLAGDWLRGWDLETLATLVGTVSQEDQRRASPEALGALPSAGDFENGRSSSLLESAILISLLACARRTLAEGGASHPSIIDVGARELLDFPLGRTSLCRYLTVACARELLQEEPALAALVTPEALASAKEYAHHGRDFYC
jgi:enoyl-CoA hydratase/carnithine racemase